MFLVAVSATGIMHSSPVAHGSPGVSGKELCAPRPPHSGVQVLEPFGTYAKAFDHVGTLGTYVDLAMRRQASVLPMRVGSDRGLTPV